MTKEQERAGARAAARSASRRTIARREADRARGCASPRSSARSSPSSGCWRCSDRCSRPRTTRPRRPPATTRRGGAASRRRAPSAPAPSSSLPDKATAEGKTYVATVTTNCGDIELTLDGEKAPQAVASFVELAKQNYWLNSPCHRLTTAETLKVLQCGDPTGTGQGTPGYGFGVENAPEDGAYPRGTVAMARPATPRRATAASSSSSTATPPCRTRTATPCSAR